MSDQVDGSILDADRSTPIQVTGPMILIRPLTSNEIINVSDLAGRIYQEALAEPFEAFAMKHRLFPAGVLGCFVTDKLAGYVFSHPWKAGAVVPIATVLGELPANPDCYYIHDCAVSKEYRGLGIGRQMAESAIQVGLNHGFKKLLLVSVNDTKLFWEGMGFKSVKTFDYALNTTAHEMISTSPAR